MSKEKQPKDPAEHGKEIKTAADLIQDAHNYRKHSETNKARIRKSIDEAGLGRSVVVDADGVLVAGNGVQQVIDGDTPVRVVETDGTELVVVKRTDLHTGDPRRKTLAFADNATADDVEWDFEAIEADGWTEESAGGWGVEWPADEEGEQQKAQEDDFDPDKPVETVCKKGDIWKLGNHRLMCGDSTDAASVALLMDGEKADITFTSPPYNAGFGKCITKDNGRSKYTNGSDDDLPQSEYREFLQKSINNALASSEFSFFNIQMLANNKTAFVDILHDNVNNLADIIVWDKQRAQPQLDERVLNSVVEFVLCFSDKGTRAIGVKKFHGTLENIIHIPPKHNEFSAEHNAVFPIDLPTHFINNFSEKSVLDLFGGSGTTLIAAEQLDRKCYMMELDPHYCDVIIARWEKLTGNKAEKLK